MFWSSDLKTTCASKKLLCDYANLDGGVSFIFHSDD